MRLKTAVAIGLVVVGGSAAVPAMASGPKLSVRAARLDKVDATTWTGKALSLPAYLPVSTFTVRVEAGTVQVDLG